MDDQSQPKVSKAEDSIASDQALEAALQDAVRAEADAHAQRADMKDIEDSYAPDPCSISGGVRFKPQWGE